MAVKEGEAIRVSTLGDDQHNTAADDAYMTKVFQKFSVLGEDADGELNGRRVLTKFNALNAAREIIGKWKNMSGKELDAFIDPRFESAWHQIDASKGDYLDVRNAYFWIRELAGEEYYSA